MSFHPYLLFDGTCREAMTFYADVFGATDLDLSTFGDGPPDYIPEGGANLIMHSQFSTGPGQILMASDMPPSMGAPVAGSVYHNAPDAGRARAVFDRLAEGGRVSIPFGPTFWSPAFGGVTDRFGTSWMISIAGRPEG